MLFLLIGPLAIMAELKSYKISHKEIRILIHIIARWEQDFKMIETYFL